jgi:hypothetical protein
VESSTRPGGFRALKKTTEAPDTTKVNYRAAIAITPAVEPPLDTLLPALPLLWATVLYNAP